ncbi:hypothetical protein [Streptomyces sp. NPDC054863]
MTLVTDLDMDEESPRMASQGFGKRSAPDQLPPAEQDFAHLRKREAIIARYLDGLPEGAAISIDVLARQLDDYGSTAIGTALKRLIAEGHLYRLRRTVKGPTGRAFLVTESYFSRTARSEEWWQEKVASVPAAVPVAPWGRW